MTVYRVECHKCFNRVEIHDGVREGIYCKSVIDGRGGIYIESGHAGTKDDPDPICCDAYAPEEKPIVLFQQLEFDF